MSRAEARDEVVHAEDQTKKLHDSDLAGMGHGSHGQHHTFHTRPTWR